MKTPVEKAEIDIPGYELFLNKKPRLGVGLYVRESLKPLEVNIGEADTEEAVWADIRIGGQFHLLIGSVYRAPSSTPENNNKINSLLCTANNSDYSHVLIMGDFNHKQIDWSSQTANCSEQHEAFSFLEAAKDSYLHQHVHAPTHFRGEQTASALDLVFTSDINMIKEIHLEAPLGKSHHATIRFLLSLHNPIVLTEKPRYLYNKGNYEEIRKDIGSTNWDEELKDKNTEDTWSTIKDRIKMLEENYIPKLFGQNGKRPRRPLWMSEKAFDVVKKKHEAFKKYMGTKGGSDYQNYAKFRNQAKWEIRKAKRAFERNVAMQAKSNPKAFYKYANSKLKTKTGIADLEKEDGTLTDNDKDKAEVLNKFFASVFTTEDTANIPHCTTDSENILDKIVITENQVLRRLKLLNPNKSQGPDGIHPRLLKEASSELASPLTILFNRSINEMTIPKEWKDGNVCPIFKKGNKSSASNYRPVSLTSVVCKLMESIVRDSIIEHMSLKFTDCQHGFLNGRSCVTQLLECLNEWTSFLDKGQAVDVIYLDFAKAFDCVPHQRLLSKLKGYGIEGQSLGWIKDFLENRRQRVIINGEASGWRHVTSGIPQGSVLGPVLFICYVNDMPEVVSGLIKIFADDTKIYSVVKDDGSYENLQKDLLSLQQWAYKWQMRFNAGKCKCLHLGTKNKLYEYKMNEGGIEVILETTKCEKDLGVFIEPDLNFSQQCTKAANKATQLVGMIRRSFDFMDKDMLRTLFKGLVRPHLEYANTIWSPLHKKDVISIENVQRRASRMVPELKELQYEERLRALKLPSLTYRRLRGDLIEMYKLLHGFYNVDTNKFLQINKDAKTRGNSLKIVKQQYRTDVRKHFLVNRVCDQWNYLPECVVDAPTLNTFKNRIDKVLSPIVYSTEFPLPLIKKSQLGE